MMTYNLGSHGKIRLWWDALPQTYCHVNNKDEYVIVHHSNMNKSSRIVVVETLLPRGGRSLYGLLGARYSDTEKENLCIQIGKCDKSSDIFNHSLIASFESAYVGIPSEYVTHVIEGAKKAQKEEKCLGFGLLEFCYAAHGLVSSNALVFEKLSFAIVNLLGYKSKYASKEQLEKMIR